MKYQLVARSGSSKGTQWQITKDLTVLGRSSECDVILPDSTVSRRHCEIVLRDGELMLTNLSGNNACLVNGVPVGHRRLKIGDELSIGVSIILVTGDTRLPPARDVSEDETVKCSYLDAQYRYDVDGEDLRDDTARTIHDLHGLYSLSLVLGGSASREEAVRNVHTFLTNAFPSCHSCIYSTSDGVNPNTIDPVLAAGSEGILSSGKDLLTLSLAEGKSLLRSAPSNENAASKVIDTMVAPVDIRGQTMGLFVVEGIENESKLGEDDLKFLTAIARISAPYLRILADCERLEKECSTIRRSETPGFSLIGGSRAIGRVRKLIRQAAQTHLSTLILGETGTGKELIARLIHELSGEDTGRYIVVNCPAIPSELFESELFGHEAGAFTGAHERRIGLVEQADGGTLFFDEIADLSLSHQARVLRVLEDGVFRRVGGGTDIQVRFRTIAATNKDLARAVELGAFREDLYHRVNAFEIQMPPLRKRPSDVQPLAEEFLRRFALVTGGQQLKLSTEAVELLKTLPLRGNVRELKNRVQRAAAMAKDRDLTSFDFATPSSSVSQAGSLPVDSSLRQAEKNHIAAVLRDCGGKVSEAAKRLEVSRSTLYKKIGEHGIAT